MKSVAIYKKAGKYYVLPQCKTDTGIIITCGEGAITESDKDLCGFLMRAFDEYKENVSHPTNWDEFRGKFYSLFGVRSSAAFYKGTLTVSADLENSSIVLTPYVNHGAKNGFEGVRENVLRIDRNAPQSSINAAILQAFSLAE